MTATTVNRIAEVLEALEIGADNPGAFDGAWFPTHGERVVSLNPATGEPIAAVHLATEGDYERVAAASVKAFGDGKREHEVRHRERHPSRAPELRQGHVHEALGVACERNHQVLHVAIALDRRVHPERMPVARHDDEILLVENPLVKAGRDLFEGYDGDVHLPGLEVGEGRAPSALQRRLARRG